jgi:RNA polymerase subunit RPABC4/transcription elongation factor Spt4
MPDLGIVLRIVVAIFGAYFLAFWLSMVIWTFRDVRARSRDIFAQLLATLLVLVFNVPGLVLYFILRPQETLAEAYERSLEEEALLQGLEERDVCPHCQHGIKSDFLFCPNCHTQLKKTCASCTRLLNLNWALCPYCGQSDASAPTSAPPQSMDAGATSQESKPPPPEPV